MPQPPETLVIRLEASTTRALDQYKRQIDAALPDGVLPPFTMAALARHCIAKWCEQNAAPVPKPWESEERE